MSGLEMLRTRHDFAALQADGRSRNHRLLTVRVRGNALGHDRFAISTGRRVGGAVVRNRLRRRVKEVLRRSIRTGGTGRDVLVVCRPASGTARFSDLRAALDQLLGQGTGEG